MNETDRRLVEEIAERDELWVGAGTGWRLTVLSDRRELLRIVRAQSRIVEAAREVVRLWTGVGSRTEVEVTQDLIDAILAAAAEAEQDRADAEAAGRATSGKWGG